MKRKIVLGLAVAVLGVVGVFAYLREGSPGGGDGSRVVADGSSARRRSVAGSAGLPRAALTPEEEARVRAALQALGNEASVRSALTAGVAQPWPLTAAQAEFEECIATVERGRDPQVPVDSPAICACMVRSIQGVYPGTPPQPPNANARKMVAEDFRTALRECREPPDSPPR